MMGGQPDLATDAGEAQAIIAVAHHVHQSPVDSSEFLEGIPGNQHNVPAHRLAALGQWTRLYMLEPQWVPNRSTSQA